MDANTQAAILCAGVLVSLTSTLLLAGCLFGLLPASAFAEWWPGESGTDSPPWCCTLALRWLWYKVCCCCRGGLHVREWLQDDLRRMEGAAQLLPRASAAATAAAEIDISGVEDRERLLRELWTRQRPAPDAPPAHYDAQLAREMLARREYFDYFKGRRIKADLSADAVSAYEYDLVAGAGTFAAAVEAARSKK